MNLNLLRLPSREEKPRTHGITVLIDSGLPFGFFRDVIESSSDFIDFVKFGWGTSLVTQTLTRKIEVLREHGVHYFFGGTLFEKFYLQNEVNEYFRYCDRHRCEYVEISNGTIDLTNEQKAEYIWRFAEHFHVFSEVGYKETEKSINLPPATWIRYIEEDLQAGAYKVITEARESGTSGICRADGELRYGLIEEFLSASLDLGRLVFEAPNKELQTYFIRKLGPNVNLGNISFHDVIGLETLRLGLRSDTLTLFEEREVYK